MPEDLHRGANAYQAPALEIGEDYILGVWLGESDVQFVRRVPLIKP